MNRLKKILLILLATSVIALIGAYIYQHLNEFTFIKNVSYPSLCLLLTLSFIYLYLQGIIYNQALNWFEFQLKPLESFGLLLLTIFGNYVLPFSGLGFRAKYLQTKYQFEYRSFTTSLLVIFIIETLVFLLGAVIACLMVNQIPKFLEYVIFLSFVGGLTIVLIKVPAFILGWAALSWMKKFLQEWDRLWSHHLLILKIILWNTLLYLVFALMFEISLMMFHLKVALPGILLVASLSNLSFMFKLTPASIGTFDGAIIFCLNLFGINIPEGIMIAGLIRFSTLFWVLFAAPVITYMYLGGKNFLKN